MRRLVIAFAVLALLAAGVLTALVIHRLQQAKDVRGSSTAEFTLTTAPATVIGNVVYFATLNKRTYALNARTGKLLWSFPDGKYTPVVAVQGRLFLIGYGTVYGMVPR